MRSGLQRFPDFGTELKRPFHVHERCYECAEFYGPGHGEPGCNAWRASKEFRCADFLKLPDVMPGDDHRQVFPPSRMKDRKVPREQEAAPSQISSSTRTPTPASAAQQIDPKRHCSCGRSLPKRRRHCDVCRDTRKQETMTRFNEKRPSRSHHASDAPQNAA